MVETPEFQHKKEDISDNGRFNNLMRMMDNIQTEVEAVEVTKAPE
jgi:hypothetical protein